MAWMQRIFVSSGALMLAGLAGCVDGDNDEGDSAQTIGNDGADADGTAGNGDGNDDGADDGGDDGADGGDEGPSGASEALCKSTCDEFLGDDCATVDEHAACFAKCEVSTDSNIDLFRSCWLNTTSCDEEKQCLDNFLETASADDGADDGNATTCVDACNAYIGMGCEPPIEGVSSCQEFCDGLTAALQDAAVMCLNDADGCELPAGCTLPSGE